MVYLELFNGRETEDQVMTDFGSKGPVIGPLPYLQTTYGDFLKFGNGMISLRQGMIYYGGLFYGDWSVISEDLVNDTPALLSRVECFDATKASIYTLRRGLGEAA